LVNRQELAGADRQWAAQYQTGDWIRYSRGSPSLKIRPNEYVRVLKIDSETNTLTVERTNGESLSYDPRRLHGVSVYEEQLNAAESRHLDYGYAVTSHSSQGQTVDRALLYIDTEQSGSLALNSRLAYVAVSRARHDVRIYTNDTEKLANALSRQTSKSSALEAWQKGEEREHSNQLPQTSLTPVAAQVVKPELTREPAFHLQP
jgi:hypothetical protein